MSVQGVRRPARGFWLRSIVVLAGLAAVGPGLARAQPAAAEQFQEKATKPSEKPKEKALQWTASLGAVLSLGNTKSWTVSGGTSFRLVRGIHAFHATGAINYGQADLPGDTRGYVNTARNINLKARYDIFFTPMDAAFVGIVYRWDTFAGLDARVQGQVGYLRNFYKSKDGKQRFWGEAGYDITYDNYYPNPLIDPTTMAVLDNTAIVHSARFFLGYDNHLNDAVTLLTGVETLLDMQDAADVRVNWNATLTSKVAKILSVQLAMAVLFDNVPVPTKEKTDFTSQLNLVFQLI